MFAISTANIDSREAKIFGRYWHHLALPEHCSLFSPELLVKCLKKSGFTPYKIVHGILTGGWGNSFVEFLQEKGADWPRKIVPSAVLGVPFEIVASLFKRSGLFTILSKATT